MMRYIYWGDRLTDPSLVGKPCDPVRRQDGKCVCGGMGTMLVEFADGTRHVVLRRRLRLVTEERAA